MKKNTLHKGFTLIELLVVVAIIGLLAATILASLGQARGKAKAARAQSEVSSMRAAAELYASSNATGYTGVFLDTTSGMKNLVTSVATAYTGATTQGETSSEWAFAVNIAGTVGIYCADSTGYSGKSTAPVDNTTPRCTH